MVVATDAASGNAQISCRIDGKPQVIEMPIADVSLHLAASPRLDSQTAADSKDRIVEKPEGWFFVAREGIKGPYPTDTAANEALTAHITALQTTTSAFR